MNIDKRLIRPAPALLLLVCIVFAAAGCDNGGGKNSPELDALVRSVTKHYTQRRWDNRRDAVSMIVIFFSGRNARDIALLKKTDEYLRVIDFLSLATRDVHGPVRMEALKSVSLLQPESLYDRVGEMALHDPDDNVRWIALDTLSQYRSEKSVEIFKKTIMSDDWVIREATVRGMVLLDENIQKKALLPFLCAAINDPNENVSCAALAGTAVRDQTLYQATAQVFRTREKPSSKMLASIMKALNGYVLEEDIRKKVISCLSHQDKDVRILALRVLKTEGRLKKKSMNMVPGNGQKKGNAL